ncbi:EamA family transporter [Roseovarius salis]|uniref:EamA family transporter n=1 Tax=Roseovarius salis TaxID=3376063 RepID=UPI0037C50AEC
MTDHPMTPVFMAFFAAILWGIWWAPILFLETLGLGGAWGSVAMSAGAALIVGVWMLATRARLAISPRGLAGAILVGTAVTTYSAALIMADVVRVILLFYLAPAWGKLLEWAFMGQRWHWDSTFALAASLSGAYLVLGGDVATIALGTGDVLAVLSGMAWAAGAALVFTGPRQSPATLTLATAAAATALGLAFIILDPVGVFRGQVSAPGMAAGVAIGTVYVMPIMFLTLWSAQRLSPAVISFLLTAEILSGVISGALFLEEPFGMMQAAGAGLILLAAVSQVLPAILKTKTPV